MKTYSLEELTDKYIGEKGTKKCLICLQKQQLLK